ncbi:MAG: hypothetical protein WC775_00415 [Patescibacteria group bacterium]|jgi:hypothetical protein
MASSEFPNKINRHEVQYPKDTLDTIALILTLHGLGGIGGASRINEHHVAETLSSTHASLVSFPVVRYSPLDNGLLVPTYGTIPAIAHLSEKQNSEETRQLTLVVPGGLCGLEHRNSRIIHVRIPCFERLPDRTISESLNLAEKLSLRELKLMAFLYDTIRTGIAVMYGLETVNMTDHQLAYVMSFVWGAYAIAPLITSGIDHIAAHLLKGHTARKLMDASAIASFWQLAKGLGTDMIAVVTLPVRATAETTVPQLVATHAPLQIIDAGKICNDVAVFNKPPTATIARETPAPRYNIQKLVERLVYTNERAKIDGIRYNG